MSVKRISDDQKGMISITVTVIIIAVVSLVTIGFAALIRRDQRQSLDKQLSTQAYYAAESGINDAIEWIKAGNINPISNCGDLPPGFRNPELSPGAAEYSCLLIDPTPITLEFNPVGTDESVIVPIDATQPITKIEFSWQRMEGGNAFLTGGASGAKHNLLNQDEWDTFNGVTEGRTSILRVDLIPTGSLDRNSLNSRMRTFFLYPQKDDTANNIGTESYNLAEVGPSGQHLIVEGHCNISNSPQYCNVELTDLGASGSGDFYIRMKSIYADSIVTVKAFSDSGQVELANAQATIDVTGKAADVVRRLQARVPLTAQFDFPEYAIETTDTICKRLNVWPATTADVAGADYTEIPAYPLPNDSSQTINSNQNKNICNPANP